jgi:hypothetical protein
MCLHDVIRPVPAAVPLPQESGKCTATIPRCVRDQREETHSSCGRSEPGMTEVEYQIRDQYREASSATSAKPAWFIITSEEIGIIHRYLSEFEQNVPEHEKECTREISRILKTVERRLA